MIDSLYNCFKHWSSKGSVYIYSDPHFGDLDSYKLRFPEGCDGGTCEHCSGSAINCPKFPMDKESVKIRRCRSCNRQIPQKKAAIFSLRKTYYSL